MPSHFCLFSTSLFTFFVLAETPHNAPFITGIRPRYRVGDILRGNCTSRHSRPAANLTWTVNNEEVSVVPNPPLMVPHPPTKIPRTNTPECARNYANTIFLFSSVGICWEFMRLLFNGCERGARSPCNYQKNIRIRGYQLNGFTPLNRPHFVSVTF